ncbi:MAG: hypothetical protein GX075_00875 [Firmicutes bacterium]|nr:hypothetical protein [Bacillota bacterium]
MGRGRIFFWPVGWSLVAVVLTWIFKPACFITWHYWLAIAFLGAIIGRIFHSYGMLMLTGWLSRISSQDLVIRMIGFLIGLLVGSLLILTSGPVIGLFDLGRRSAFIITILVFCAGFFMLLAATKSRELADLLFNIQITEPKKIGSGKDLLKILDTSAIIDGRIADLCKTGFLEGVLVIPHFVLNELQKIADSSDPLRRNRGRRGLDILNKIQKENQVSVRIFDLDYEELNEVDTKLLRLAKELDAKVVTNDFNLNKVAELYGVEVLNINELSNAIKPVVLPGEEMMVHVLRDGKEYGQGIGYLEDGTMIVIEGGKSYIGLDIEIMVTSVLQTSAGRMIFAKPKEYLVSKANSL